MSLSSLQPLADPNNRQALLLAEVAALLHDMGKCADEHIINQASDKPSGYSYRYKTAQSHRLPAGLANINLLGGTVSGQTLIEQGMPRVINNRSQPWLLRVLGKCHAVAHVEKELSDRDTATKQPKDDTRLSTAYGFEGGPVTGLTTLLDSLPFNDLTNRSIFVPPVRKSFEQALGDTRRPVNEVTLADWSDTVATLYKSALAGGLLGIKPDPDHLHWRLLRVNFDVLGLYAKAVKIADLLGYQRAVDEACEQVKKLVEEEYPLGNEVYRDTSGIYFTFPDFDPPADLAQEIRRRVEEIEPELAPRVAVTIGNGATATEQLKGILAKARKEAREALAHPLDTENLGTEWQRMWANLPADEKWEVCPVCRLRPMREGREACKHCEKRRSSRIADWQANPQRTTWMDEIADHNGRVALIVGRFGLDDWLSGDLVQTMLVKADPANNTFTPKSPSPARLRRVWETCRRFWTETVQGILKALPGRERWLLEVQEIASLPPTDVVCDGTFNGSAISVWRMGDSLLTISFLPEQPKPGLLNISWEQKGQKKNATYQVKSVSRSPADYLCYHPTLTLLASPDQFLALVPAADALEIADKIRKEYAKQFGKVQNRLPLFLGLVFFPRKMPLVAVMDTARRMLDQVEFIEETWRVECNSPTDDSLKHCVRLSSQDKRMDLAIPVKMGDETTDDVWYPYFFFVERFAGSTPNNRSLRFQHNGHWLVHVKELKEGDVVSITPSRFAYLFLESTAQRFRFDPQKDVLLLDELPCLMEIWKAICRSPDMTDTKLQAIHALFESKRQEWGLDKPNADQTAFRHLVEATFKRDSVQGVTLEDVLNGRFHRCIDLYLRILKRCVSDEKKQEVHYERQTV